MAAKRVTVHLAEPLGCCVFDGWKYCERPALVALGEPVAAATGHWWKLVPVCDVHQVIAQRGEPVKVKR